MTDKATLLLLAERCEKATEADRQLDYAIALALRIIGLQHPPQFIMAGSTLDNKMPRYTASLDAAMTLVPEGWNTALGGTDAYAWKAELARGNAFGTGARSARCPSAALALCAASLRARAAMMEDEGE